MDLLQHGRSDRNPDASVFLLGDGLGLPVDINAILVRLFPGISNSVKCLGHLAKNTLCISESLNLDDAEEMTGAGSCISGRARDTIL